MPMHTPQDRADGERVTAADLGARLTTLSLEGRDALPHALNGRSIPPSDPRAANIRREMQQGRSREFARLLTVMLCDLTDGVPFPLVIAPLRQMIATLEVAAVQQHQHRALHRPVTALMARETKAQARFDLAELKVAESPACEIALSEAIREASAHEAAIEAVREGMERDLAVIRTTRRPVYGRRTTAPRLEVAR